MPEWGCCAWVMQPWISTTRGRPLRTGAQVINLRSRRRQVPWSFRRALRATSNSPPFESPGALRARPRPARISRINTRWRERAKARSLGAARPTCRESRCAARRCRREPCLRTPRSRARPCRKADGSRHRPPSPPDPITPGKTCAVAAELDSRLDDIANPGHAHRFARRDHV